RRRTLMQNERRDGTYRCRENTSGNSFGSVIKMNLLLPRLRRTPKALILLLGLVTAIAVAWYINPLHRPAWIIRASLLRAAPIGSNKSDLVAYLESQGYERTSMCRDGRDRSLTLLLGRYLSPISLIPGREETVVA